MSKTKKWISGAFSCEELEFIDNDDQDVIGGKNLRNVRVVPLSEKKLLKKAIF